MNNAKSRLHYYKRTISSKIGSILTLKMIIDSTLGATLAGYIDSNLSLCSYTDICSTLAGYIDSNLSLCSYTDICSTLAGYIDSNLSLCSYTDICSITKKYYE